MPVDASARLIALTRAYLAADYRWRHGDAWQALAIGAPATPLEHAFPDARAFGVLTAWNPHSEPQDAAGNAAADARLRRDLDAAGILAVAAESGAPTQGWREPGWLLPGLSCEACDTLARRYRQLGALWWRRGDAVALRMYASRPAAYADDARVVWAGVSTF